MSNVQDLWVFHAQIKIVQPKQKPLHKLDPHELTRRSKPTAEKNEINKRRRLRRKK